MHVYMYSNCLGLKKKLRTKKGSKMESVRKKKQIVDIAN